MIILVIDCDDSDGFNDKEETVQIRPDLAEGNRQRGESREKS
jgi:hypothetical protein